jgi:hypothetical protein
MCCTVLAIIINELVGQNIIWFMGLSLFSIVAPGKLLMEKDNYRKELRRGLHDFEVKDGYLHIDNDTIDIQNINNQILTTRVDGKDDSVRFLDIRGDIKNKLINRRVTDKL